MVTTTFYGIYFASISVEIKLDQASTRVQTRLRSMPFSTYTQRQSPKSVYITDSLDITTNIYILYADILESQFGMARNATDCEGTTRIIPGVLNHRLVLPVQTII